RISVMLPAVPTSKEKRPAVSFPGRNSIDDAPGDALVTSALHNAATALIAVTCCAARPGVGRPARIRTTRTGVSVRADRATAIRRSWPPPSPRPPTTSIMDVGLTSDVEGP